MYHTRIPKEVLLPETGHVGTSKLQKGDRLYYEGGKLSI
jgi:hypothetical protein